MKKQDKDLTRDDLTVRSSSGEDQDRLIKRFTKKVRMSGLVKELLFRRAYEKPSEKRKRKERLARHAARLEDKESTNS